MVAVVVSVLAVFSVLLVVEELVELVVEEDNK